MLLSFEIHYGSGHHFLEKDKPYNPGMLYFRESPFFPGADVSQSVFFADTVILNQRNQRKCHSSIKCVNQDR